MHFACRQANLLCYNPATEFHSIYFFMSTENIWLAIGFLGQGIFFMRWVVQWLASERSAESRVPIGFWYLSMVGGLITLAYAIYRKDPVFIAGQSIGTFVYIRNLMLIQKQSASIKAGPEPPDSSDTPAGDR
jgi:Predicted membrane protein